MDGNRPIIGDRYAAAGLLTRLRRLHHDITWAAAAFGADGSGLSTQIHFDVDGHPRRMAVHLASCRTAETSAFQAFTARISTRSDGVRVGMVERADGGCRALPPDPTKPNGSSKFSYNYATRS